MRVWNIRSALAALSILTEIALVDRGYALPLIAQLAILFSFLLEPDFPQEPSVQSHGWGSVNTTGRHSTEASKKANLLQYIVKVRKVVADNWFGAEQFQ